jgi:hypothetical protein
VKHRKLVTEGREKSKSLVDKTVTGEERASRKRRLISGPKEFRGIRRK